MWEYADLDRPVSLHRLTFLPDGQDVTVGRTDIDSYAIFPVDGAELVQRLESGLTPRAAASWYAATYGEQVDIRDVLAGLEELGFIRSAGEPDVDMVTVRWRRLGSALFSPPMAVIAATVLVWAGVLMANEPELVPNYSNIFYTDYFTLIKITLILAAIPQLMLHEVCHVLAARRLGLRSSLRVDHRLYFIVLEASLDGLVAVPRRQRYLPILAGMLADVVVIAALTITADLLREPDGDLSLASRFCLAFAFAVALRVVWQFFFYLRTDLYVLISTLLGCVDLHATARRTLWNRVNRLLGRHDRLHDETLWHSNDRRVARWYSWLMVAGYTVSITTLLVVIIPIVYRMYTGVIARFVGHGEVSQWELLDSVVFSALLLVNFAILACLAIRDRRRRRRERKLQHVIT